MIGRRKTLYLPDDVIEEMRRESKRQGRPLSQILYYAWRIAQPTIAKLPTVIPPKENAR